jgi:cation transport regulator ChaB
MPYTGIGDDKLPKAVQKLPKKLREIWVAVFNKTYDSKNEGAAFQAAWGAVRKAQEAKKMSLRVGVTARPASAAAPGGATDEATTKSVNLGKLVEEIQRRLVAAFPYVDLYAREVFDDHLIVRVYMPASGPVDVDVSPLFFKVPYQLTMKPIEGDPNGGEVLDTITFAPREQWVRVLPTFVEFKTIDQPDGRTRWVMLSSGGFEDRDREIVSTAFLEAAVKAADKSGQRGPLLIYHVPGSNIGACDTQAVVGEPGFLLESGLFDDTPAGQAAAVYYKEHAAEKGGSIRFLWVNRTGDGVYLPPGLVLERSVLPRDKAAFPWSGIQLMEVDQMAKLEKAKQEELERVLGPELAAQIVSQLEQGSSALKELGIRWKEISGEAPAGQAAPAAPTTPTAPVAPAAPAADKSAAAPVTPADPPAQAGEAAALQPVEWDVVFNAEAIGAMATEVAKQVAGDVEKTLTGALDGLNTLHAAVRKMSADLEELKRSEDERVADKVRNLPRATLKQIQRPTQTRPQTDNGGNAPPVSLEERGKQALYGPGG